MYWFLWHSIIRFFSSLQLQGDSLVRDGESAPGAERADRTGLGDTLTVFFLARENAGHTCMCTACASCCLFFTNDKHDDTGHLNQGINLTC